MSDVIDHIASGLALLLGGLAAWFARRAGRNATRQSLEGLAAQAVDAALAVYDPAARVPLITLSVEHFLLLDMRDGKPDFNKGQAFSACAAELARRGKSLR